MTRVLLVSSTELFGNGGILAFITYAFTSNIVEQGISLDIIASGNRLAQLYALHWLLFALSIFTSIVLIIARLSIRFMQRGPLLRIEVPLLCGHVLTTALFFVSLLCTSSLLMSQNRLSIYYGIVTWVYVSYHFAVYLIFSRHSLRVARCSLAACLKHEEPSSFDDIDDVLNELFKDLGQTLHISVAFDSMVLTRAYQRYRTQSISVSTMKDAALQHEFDDLVLYARALRHATGVYGLVAAFFTSPSACLNVGVTTCCTSGESRRRHGFLALSELQDDDILLGNYTPTVCLPAFIVCVDHSHRVIWIAISGTTSVADVATDLQAFTKDLPEYPGSYAHSGIWTAATNIGNALREGRAMTNCLAQHPDYELILTGHSLGGATASLLHVQLQKSPLYDVGDRVQRCIAFGCPPIVSEDLARSFDDIIQVGIIDDVVTHLAVNRVKHLMAQITVLTEALHLLPDKHRMPRRWECSYDQKLEQALQSFFASLDLEEVDNRIDEQAAVMIDGKKHRPLFVPGTHVQLRPAWSAEELTSDPDGAILVTPSMLLSHTFLAHKAALKQAIEECQNDQDFLLAKSV